MKYKFRFDPLAAHEYENAYSWYLARSEKAAENFIYAVEDGINLVRSDPYRYRRSYKDLREISLIRYPYYLIYIIDESKKIIIITSVYHHKRNPRRKYKK